MKRKIWIGLAGILCAGLLAGCGKEGENSGSKDAGEEEKKVLTVLLNGTASDAFVDDYQEIIDRFNEENNYDVTIEPEFVGNAEYKARLATMMATDTQPDIIYTWELGSLENFVNAGKIVSLQEYLDADPDWKKSFQAGTLELETYGGEAYGIPTARCIAVMYYNKEIFEKYSLEVPETYEEYCQVCETLLANGVTPVAMAAAADDAWMVSQYIQQLSNGIAGVDLYEGIKNGTRGWNDEGMEEAAKLFQEEAAKGYFADGFAELSSGGAKWLFQEEKAAMYFNGSWDASNLDNPNIGCFILPAVKEEYQNIVVGALDNSYAVTSNCEDVEAAVAFLKFWSNEENASMLLYECGRIPATDIRMDEGRLSSLCQDVLACFEQQKVLTPWFDRVDAGSGNRFNQSCVEIGQGKDVKTVLDALQKEDVRE